MKIKLEKIRCAYTELFNRWKETQINNDNDYFEEQLSILTDIIEQAEVREDDLTCSDCSDKKCKYRDVYDTACRHIK